MLARGVPITIEWHSELGGLAREWDSLADRTDADPFRRPGWIGAWHEAFGGGPLRIIEARRHGRLVAVLPLERAAGALRSPANWHTPVFGAVAESAEAVDALARALLDDRPRRASLAFLDSGDPLRDALLEHARRLRYRTLDMTVQRSPYLDLDGGWEAIWRGLPSKRRNNLKRRRRRLEERGTLTLEVSDGTTGLREQLDEALRVEALGWKGSRGSAIASRAETDAFYRRVAAWSAEQGTFRLALLRTGGQLVAFDYALEAHNRHYLLKTGFDPRYREGAPGIVLRAMMIERACALRLGRYEFLGGEDEYKREWTAAAHDRRRVHAFAPSPGGLATWVAFRYGRPLAKRILERAR